MYPGNQLAVKMDGEKHRLFASRLLRQEAVPAMGCTEPGALALAAAAASAMVRGELVGLSLAADLGTYKNTLAVGLPNTEERGPAIVAAAGALIADPSLSLGVLGAATGEIWDRARALVKDGKIAVASVRGHRGVFIQAEIEKAGGTARAVIRDRHDRIECVFRNGRPAALPEPKKSGEPEDGEIGDAEIRDRLCDPAAVLDHAEALDDEDLTYIRRGIDLNLTMARQVLEQGTGLGYGLALSQIPGRETGLSTERVQALVAAGIEGRMSGAPLPVMTSGGSGNAGLTVTLGTYEAARLTGGFSESEVMRAVGLAHLMNVAIKARIGRVGPLCGGAIASAVGVGCGFCRLLGGDAAAMDLVVRAMVNAVAGSICDGAKPACAFRINSALGTALQLAALAAGGKLQLDRGGLSGPSGKTAFLRLSKLVRGGYGTTDAAIVSILAEQG